MSHLLLSTSAMMILTFIIGFLVAGIIKLIAVWADSLDFYNSHQEEIMRLKRLRKYHQKMAKNMEREAIKIFKIYDDKRDEFSRGINEDPRETSSRILSRGQPWNFKS